MSQPPPSEPSDTGPARLIDKVCDRFELAWRAGQGPRIEEYLDRAPAEVWRPLLRELLVSELELRAKAGDEAKLEEYLARFPGHEEIVREAFGTTPTVRHVPAEEPAATHDHRGHPASPWRMQVRCPHCHNPIEIVESDSLREIKCPSCDSLFSLVGSEGQRADAAGKRIGHFELLELLGTGGFGTVYKARDTKLDRIVALKIPRRSQLDAEELEKFFHEARAAAQLKHPNIVSVHEVGRDGETVYIVSDYIEGLPLDKWLEGQKVTPREAAALCEKIARALHHAHEAGVVHRDLKPSNIILDRAGEPHVMDFGLAKREAGEITMTVDGQILGTPAYMSPEQARGEGHKADRRTDVYSLGVILYQLLTGELPFRGSMRMLLAQVLEDDPPSPRRLDSSIPRDLETIALKCMEKDARVRYAHAGSLADELVRFLHGEPIQARPIDALARAWRWCKRNTAVATLCAVALTLLLGGLVVLAFLARTSIREAKVSSQKAEIERLSQRFSTRAQDLTKFQIQKTRDAKYAIQITAAQKAWENNNRRLAKRIMEDAPRGWETPYWPLFFRQDSQVLHGHTGSISSMSFTSDGLLLATGSADKTVKVWDADSGKCLHTLRGHGDAVASVDFSPDGRRLVSGSADSIINWDMHTGRSMFVLRRQGRLMNRVLFSPDGKMIASSGDDSVTIWEAETGRELIVLQGARGESDLSFNAGGTQITSCGNMLTVWDLKTGQAIRAFPHGSYMCRFGPQGRLLARIDHVFGVQVWDVESNTEKVTLVGHFAEGGHSPEVTCFAFTPDGQRIVSAGKDQTVRVWSADSGQELFAIAHNSGNITALSVSGDGQRLACGNSDNTIRVWNTTCKGRNHAQARPGSDQVFQTLCGHEAPVERVSFSPDGRRIVSIDHQGAMKEWDLTAGTALVTLRDPATAERYIASSADCSRIVRASPSGEVSLWNSTTREKVSQLETTWYSDRRGCVEFSPDGRRIVGRYFDDICVWDTNTGRRVTTLDGEIRSVCSLAFSPDGRKIASGILENSIKVWGANRGGCLLTLRGHKERVGSVCFSPDSRRIASGSDDTTVRIWDAVTGRDQLTLKGHSAEVCSIAFSPDSQWLVSGARDNIVKLWDATTGKETAALDVHTDDVTSVAFSPDGRRVVSGSEDKTIIIWDALPEPKSN